MFGFKAYAIVIYFVLLAALSQLLNATFVTSLNYNEIKKAHCPGFEPGLSIGRNRTASSVHAFRAPKPTVDCIGLGSRIRTYGLSLPRRAV